ncbi:hypothetical protein [Sphingobacterium rhinopitheci]|uniref:hypothetical protein n=1 Tax=Sphingobacterium rhinopitheci TaxID=2781960 RepID=UPI001F52AF69|nr:hypothetical protein [Sphingobacterium rhinopitheci]MCI0922734.1 hypothetical protein [Sphingobacterium rhinopitheci]
MAIIETTSRKFRERQKDFFDLADNGERILIRRGSKQAYVLTPVSNDDLYFSKEVVERVKEAQQEVKQGKYVSFDTADDLDRYIQSL